MDPLLLVVVSVTVTVLALVVWAGNGVLKSQQSSGSRLASLNTRDDVLDQDFSQRAVAPVLTGLGRFATRFTPTGWVARAQKKLIWAGWAERMKAAHYNSVESLVVFAALVLIANAAGITNDTTVLACQIYFWARLAHLLFYTFAVPFGRTLAFAVAWLCQVALLLQIL